ncbi:MAG: DUF4249 domain-containing protein [Ginsengibacter sp.]|jgi:hypothetical protein
MKNKLFVYTAVFFSFVLLLVGCKDPYNPVLKYQKTNFLIVEGYIDGAAPTQFMLSRSRALTGKDTEPKIVEKGARVAVEDDKNNQNWLIETGNGGYSSIGTLNLNPSNKYRIHIYTKDGGEYTSDFVAFKSSPAIDKIGFKIKEGTGDAQIYVNTHDASGATKYYRWEYDQTWEFHTLYETRLKYDGLTKKVIDRTDAVRICWRDASLNRILINNSTKLTEDRIDEMPLVLIPNHSQQLSVLYSIKVKQYALDVNAFNFWEAMKKNTEEVGSIFDPQPNQTMGNIHSVKDINEPVVGYVSAGNSYSQRVFIKNSDVPSSWNSYPDCPQIIVPNIKDSVEFYFGSGQYLPINTFLMDGGREGYTAAYPACVDCTIFGTNVKPVFWP